MTATELLAAAVTALGGATRPGQVAMTEAVATALESERHLAVQAGTGTGKSLAYLVPAVAHAQETDSTVIVSTATIALQRQLVDRDLPRLAESLEPLLDHKPSFAIMKGRQNYLCQNKVAQATALEADDPNSGDADGNAGDAQTALVDESELSWLGQHMARIYEWANETETGDRDSLEPGVPDLAWRQVSVGAKECIGANRCPFGDSCFAELARRKARDVDVVVTNHALLAINSFEGLGVLPEHDIVIIDEAHELADRVTGAVTGSLSAAMVRRAAQGIRKNSKASPAALENAASSLEEAFLGVPEGLLKGLDRRLLTAVSAVNDAARGALSDSKTDSKEVDAGLQMARSRVSEVHEESGRILEAFENREVLWVSRPRVFENGRYHDANDTDPATLHIAPLSIGSRLREGLFEDRTVILTSATLAVGESFDAAAGALGLMGTGAPRWEGIDVGSPFDYPKQGVMYVAADLPKPGFGVSTPQLQRLLELCEAANGGALGLFSSKRGAEQAAEYVRQHSDLTVLLQGESSLRALVDEFTEDMDACLFGTMSLWQGVDVPGDSCRLVVMDRIPFPRPNDPLVQARTEAVQANRGNGFMAVSAYHAAIRMAQGAGRLIRSVHDRGVVAILDSRLATQRYGGYLMRAMPNLWTTQDKNVVLGALERLYQSID